MYIYREREINRERECMSVITSMSSLGERARAAALNLFAMFSSLSNLIRKCTSKGI